MKGVARVMKVSGQRFGVVRLSLLAIGLLVLTTGCTTTGLSTVYYDVPGATVEQISQQIFLRAPKKGRSLVQVETRMTPKVETEYGPGGCRITSVEIEDEVKITLPRWTELDKADQRTRKSFQELSGYLDWYAQQHLDIYRRHQRLIEEKIAAVEPQPICWLTLRKAKEVFQESWDEHNEEQLAFQYKEDSTVTKRLNSL